MKFSKVVALTVAVCLIMCSAIAQENTRSESDVEGIYTDTAEGAIISSLASIPDYASKMLALEYAEIAINEGRMSPAIEVALHDLASEGVLTESRMGGRLTNNYPEARMQACRLLAESPTEKTKDILLSLIGFEKEPMVLAEAINSLGEIGINDNDEVINQIAIIHRRFSLLNPSSTLAYSVLDAFEKLSPTVEDSSAMIETIAGIAANYNYIVPVRQKAQAFLDTLRNNN